MGIKLVLLFILFLFNFSLARFSDIGVLVLAHGGRPHWNQTVLKAVEPLRKNYQVEVAFGMANPLTIQSALQRLEAKGVKKVVVIPLFISSHSPIIRQLRYILGYSDKFPDDPMVPLSKEEKKLIIRLWDILEKLPAPLAWWIQEEKPPPEVFDKVISLYISEEERIQVVSLYSKVLWIINKKLQKIKPIDTKVNIILTDPIDDHPIVTSIVCRRILELSIDPSKEAVILVAHGPNGEEDNVKWLTTMESIGNRCAKQIYEEKGKSFRAVLSVTVRDDAPEPIYEQAKQHLRALVRQLSASGDVIVIPLLISQGGIEHGILKRLEGLKFRWSGKTILPSEEMVRFLESRIREALQSNIGRSKSPASPQ